MNREEIIASLEEKKAYLGSKLDARERLLRETEELELQIEALEDKLDDNFIEYEKLWTDLQRVDELSKSVNARMQELVYSDTKNYAKWRRFLARKKND